MPYWQCMKLSDIYRTRHDKYKAWFNDFKRYQVLLNHADFQAEMNIKVKVLQLSRQKCRIIVIFHDGVKRARGHRSM